MRSIGDLAQWDRHILQRDGARKLELVKRTQKNISQETSPQMQSVPRAQAQGPTEAKPPAVVYGEQGDRAQISAWLTDGDWSEFCPALS